MRRPQTILEITKKAIFPQVMNKSIIYNVFKVIINHREKINRVVVLAIELSLKPLNTETTDETF